MYNKKKKGETMRKHKVEQLKSMPIVQTKSFKSADGNYIVTQFILTQIRPIEFFEKIIKEAQDIEDDSVQF